jgi:hypothetical protein
VAGLVEEVGVDVERDRDARVAEDAADLDDVEAQVEDQVAGERVPQVVEAKRWPPAAVEPRALCRTLKRAPLNVAMPERGAATGREDPGAPRVEGRARRCSRSTSASWATSGTSRTAARVLGATRRAGTPRWARESWARTWITPAAKSTSSQTSPSSSEIRNPE